MRSLGELEVELFDLNEKEKTLIEAVEAERAALLRKKKVLLNMQPELVGRHEPTVG